MTETTETADVSRPSTVPVSAGVAPDGVAEETVAEDVIPSTGAYRNDKHEYWFNGEGPVPSVTTILQIVDKPAVGIHKAKEAARAVYQQFKNDFPDPWGSEEEAIKWALKEADKTRDTAAEMGSSVHLLADLAGASESGSKGWQLSKTEIPYVAAYEDFLGRYGRSSIVSSEHMVWSLKGYAGTYDQLMTLPECVGRSTVDGYHDPLRCDCNRDLWLVDIKTSGKGPYPEWALQLAAYAWAHWIIVPGQSQPHQMPAVMRFGVLHLRPDLYTDTGWRLIEYPVREKDYEAFLSALNLWRWRKEGRFTKSQLNKQ